MSNLHEHIARERKVALMRLLIDSLALKAGYQPTDPAVAAQIVRFLETFESSMWAGLAYAAGINDPSVFSQKLLIKEYRARASLERRTEVQ